MVDEPSYCQAFRCLDPTVDLRPDNEMRVHPIDRSVSLGSKLDSPQVLDQVMVIHKGCFNRREYAPAVFLIGRPLPGPHPLGRPEPLAEPSPRNLARTSQPSPYVGTVAHPEPAVAALGAAMPVGVGWRT